VIKRRSEGKRSIELLVESTLERAPDF